MNAHERLACEGLPPVAVMGNPSNGFFCLLELGVSEPDYRDELYPYVQYEPRLLGVFGIDSGVPRSAFTEPLDDTAANFIAQKYLHYLAGVFARKQAEAAASTGQLNLTVSSDTLSPNDSEQFLWRLWSLRDPRNG